MGGVHVRVIDGLVGCMFRLNVERARHPCHVYEAVQAATCRRLAMVMCILRKDNVLCRLGKKLLELRRFTSPVVLVEFETLGCAATI